MKHVNSHLGVDYKRLKRLLASAIVKPTQMTAIANGALPCD